MLEFIIFLLIVFICVLIFFMMRLINKIQFYEDWIVAFRNRVMNAHDTIQKIDIRGSFQADDEIGFIFKVIKQLVDDLQKFIV